MCLSNGHKPKCLFKKTIYFILLKLVHKTVTLSGTLIVKDLEKWSYKHKIFTWNAVFLIRNLVCRYMRKGKIWSSHLRAFVLISLWQTDYNYETFSFYDFSLPRKLWEFWRSNLKPALIYCASIKTNIDKSFLLTFIKN